MRLRSSGKGPQLQPGTIVWVYVLLCAGMGCSEDQPRDDLGSLLKANGIESPAKSAHPIDTVLFAQDRFVVWLRRAVDRRKHLYRRDSRRAAVHVFSGSKSSGVISVDADGGNYAPEVRKVPSGVLVLSYRFGRASMRIEECEYVAQVHLVTPATCEVVLEVPFKPLRYDPTNRMTATCFSFAEDVHGRLLMMRMEYTNSCEVDPLKVTAAEGSSVYIWNRSSRRFAPIAAREIKGNEGESPAKERQ